MTNPTTITIDNRTYRLVPVEPEQPAPRPQTGKFYIEVTEKEYAERTAFKSPPKPQTEAEFWCELANGLPQEARPWLLGSADAFASDMVLFTLNNLDRSTMAASWHTPYFSTHLIGSMASYVASEPGACVRTNVDGKISWTSGPVDGWHHVPAGPHAFSIALAACCKAIAERRAGKA